MQQSRIPFFGITFMGATSKVVKNRISTGSWDGSFEAAVDGASTGYMFAGIGTKL